MFAAVGLCDMNCEVKYFATKIMLSADWLTSYCSIFYKSVTPYVIQLVVSYQLTESIQHWCSLSTDYTKFCPFSTDWIRRAISFIKWLHEALSFINCLNPQSNVIYHDSKELYPWGDDSWSGEFPVYYASRNVALLFTIICHLTLSRVWSIHSLAPCFFIHFSAAPRALHADLIILLEGHKL
jgi:hypothetical protein